MELVKLCSPKDCRRRGGYLPFSDFHKDKGKDLGVKSQCKECSKIAKMKSAKGLSKMTRIMDSSDYYLTMSSKSQREIFNRSSRVILSGCSYA